MSSPPFVLDHVAVGVADAAKAGAFLAGRLGARPYSSGPGLGFRWWQWELAGEGRLEVLEPDGEPGGFLHRFLELRGPGVHHVTFKVSVLEDAIARARAAGYDVVGELTLDPSWKEAFLHPKGAQGIVVQLAEAHPELEPDDLPRYPFEGIPDQAPEPSGLVGLRLSSRSAERARHQWQETLGGTCTDSDGDLVFRWPDSPLRIAVNVDPFVPEGPLGLEIAPRGDGALPSAVPALGAPLLAVDA